MYYHDYNPAQLTLNLNPILSPEERHLRSDGHRCFIIRHRYDRILAELRVLIEPYVERGYDAQQIKDELRKHDPDSIYLINNIETVISTIRG